jgi:GTP cyclohydrolase I
MNIVDIQASSDERGIPIDRVGVRDLRYPITVLTQAGEPQYTVAQVSLSVTLPHRFKGTHMSRFLQVLEAHRGELTMRTIPPLLADLQERLEAEQAQVRIEFPYFIERSAPVTGVAGLMDYDCWFDARIAHDEVDFLLGVQVPVTNLCPCSKVISDYGAHNQRGDVQVEVRSRADVAGKPQIIWIEEIVALVDACASAPVYPILKREDERHVTMQAYDNPRFVEDAVRDIAGHLMDDLRTAWFKVEVDNHESIHNHDAFAIIEWSHSE